MSHHFQKIGILGGGLLGGSAALALRDKADVRLWFRKPGAIAPARAAGFSEATDNLAEAVSEVNLLILAVPVGAMPALLSAAVAAGLPKDCLVTDVGSVKVTPHRDLAPVLAASGNPFIGSHPMAGSERNGLVAASTDLFRNAACLLTNDDAAPPDLCSALEDFWKSLGCRTKWLSAAEHDRLVARISHLPHVTAAATVFAALSADSGSGNFSGGGLRDTTRVAGGNPEMWAEILLENRCEVSRSIRETISKLNEFLVALDGVNQEELRNLLDEAKALRDTLTKKITPMSSLRVKAISSLHAEFSVPGDKSVSHRAAILGGLSNGVCEISNFLPSEDCLNTLKAMSALGARFEILEEMNGYGPTKLRIHGRSMKLTEPGAPIDCGNSGTGMRLLAGLLAGLPFTTELFGDSSLSSRPMGRITIPLAEMGANIETLGDKPGCAPLRIHGGKLKPITYEMPVASAQVKSAVLLAGMFADGTTTVIQPATTRDHTERMFASFRISCQTNGNTITLPGGQIPESCDFTVPGDISSAAFWLVAAAAMNDSRLLIKDTGLNPTRTAILKVLSRMGAQMTEILHTTDGEPIGHVEIHGAPLKGTTLFPEEIPNLIDEIPVIAVAAALAEGDTHIRNARELRVKETDRITTTVENLLKMGADVEELEDGMIIHGGRPLKGAEIESHGDHRIAMAFAIAGLFAEGETVIHGTDCINTSYPGFAHHLAAILRESRDTQDFILPTTKP